MLGLLATCGSTSSEPSVDVATETADDTTNQTSPSPDCDYPFTTETPLLVSISVSSPSPKQIEDAGLGKFQWGTTPEVVLSPPIDWNQDPFDDRSWRYGLHSMNATLYRILLDYQSNGNLDSLELGAEVALD